MLDEDDRVGVFDGRQQQALHVIGGGGHDDFQAGDVDEPRFQAFGVLGGRACAGAGGRAQHHWHLRLAAEHEAHLRALQDELLHRQRNEIHKLDLGHWPHAGRRCADGRPGNNRFGDGRVADALRAELFNQAVADAERAAIDTDVLAEHEDTLIPFHRQSQRFAHGQRIG